MLCRKLRQTINTKSSLITKTQYSCLIKARFFSKRCMIFDSFLSKVSNSEGRHSMTSFRFILKDFSVRKLWGVWTRSYILNKVVKRCKRERAVREVFDLFRQTILRPRRTFFLSATAAFKSYTENSEKPPSCEQNITDEELQALMTELDGVDQLSKNTLYCTSCGKRVIIEKKLTGVAYCACKDASNQEASHEGWVPYMEAEDVIIWRKEYKHGQGLYAYKVYGRYKDVCAQDFAAVQVDGAYRRVWDSAVAALSVVERGANGLMDQAVLHWEVLWPRLFANRDYVYIRRHKEYEVKSATPCVNRNASQVPLYVDRPNVHSNAKRKALEEESLERQRQIDEGVGYDNKMFVIISRSCEHPDVPETKHAIRVAEYWSHMVVKSTHGPEKPGMEFVLTYYDEPAVGGLPSGVAAWATGRAAPAYLDRMRRAAADYGNWREAHHQDLPDFVAFGQGNDEPQGVSVKVREQDMESSKEGPELDNGVETKRDQGTQTDIEPCKPSAEVSEPTPNDVASESTAEKNEDKHVIKSKPAKDEKVKLELNIISDKEVTLKGDKDKPEEEVNTSNTGRWWRYLYPFYYFV